MKKYLKPEIAVQNIMSAAFLEDAISNYEDEGDGDQLSNGNFQDSFKSPARPGSVWDNPEE
jgi:hypothetical protein